MDSWCTIESDPGVFTELITSIGVKNVQVEELWSLDEQLFAQIKPVYGLIFLFKWRPDDGREVRNIVTDYEPSQLFFARQVITNACATQAILSILLNCSDIDLGPELKQFKEFTQHFDPETLGLAISNSPLIRNVHNSFARPEPFVTKKEVSAGTDDDVFHFISYLPVNGILYELDGLKSGPISHGPCTNENWLEIAKPVIEQRISKYSNSEIRFNLMAIIANRQAEMKSTLADLESRKAKLQSKLDRLLTPPPPEDTAPQQASSDDAMEIAEDQQSGIPQTKEQLQTQIQHIQAEQQELSTRLQQEEAKFKQWKIENIRRKHNYIPFIVGLLKLLADKGELLPLIDKAKASGLPTK